MTYNNSSSISNVDDVKVFFHHVVAERNVNFHPDDDFADYISTMTKEPSFSKEEAEIYNRLLDESFQVCERMEADVYSIGLDELEQKLEI